MGYKSKSFSFGLWPVSILESSNPLTSVSWLMYSSVAQITCLGLKSHFFGWIRSLALSLSTNTSVHVTPSAVWPSLSWLRFPHWTFVAVVSWDAWSCNQLLTSCVIRVLASMLPPQRGILEHWLLKPMSSGKLISLNTSFLLDLWVSGKWMYFY